jgi:hypothetical protein
VRGFFFLVVALFIVALCCAGIPGHFLTLSWVFWFIAATFAAFLYVALLVASPFPFPRKGP